MPLTITTSETPVGPPSFRSPADIAAMAVANGTPAPAGATVVGITIPVIRHDFRSLNFHTRNGGTEFRFNTGTLPLTLRQEIHVSNALGPCAQTIWLQHEMLHAGDNSRLLDDLEPALRADPVFASLLVHPVDWHPRPTFSSVQATIAGRIGAIFQDLTREAARRRDTAHEYRRVDRQIRARCGKAVDDYLRPGEYGQGIDILQIALNSEPSSLPRLSVDGIYGPATTARVIEYQNANGLEDDGIAGPDTQDSLGITGMR
ncbi:MAG: peptidoglycan-binding domain-containing protein [Pseudomonadota bacterium]